MARSDTFSQATDGFCFPGDEQETTGSLSERVDEEGDGAQGMATIVGTSC